jgi:hypothetical protein
MYGQPTLSQPSPVPALSACSSTLHPSGAAAPAASISPAGAAAVPTAAPRRPVGECQNILCQSEQGNSLQVLAGISVCVLVQRATELWSLHSLFAATNAHRCTSSGACWQMHKCMNMGVGALGQCTQVSVGVQR